MRIHTLGLADVDEKQVGLVLVGQGDNPVDGGGGGHTAGPVGGGKEGLVAHPGADRVDDAVWDSGKEGIAYQTCSCGFNTRRTV